MPKLTAQEQSREDARKALARAVKRERDVQRLTKALDRAITKSDRRLLVFSGQLQVLLKNRIVDNRQSAVVDRERAVGE